MMMNMNDEREYESKWNEIYDEVRARLPKELDFNIKWEITWEVYNKYLKTLKAIPEDALYKKINPRLQQAPLVWRKDYLNMRGNTL